MANILLKKQCFLFVAVNRNGILRNQKKTQQKIFAFLLFLLSNLKKINKIKNLILPIGFLTYFFIKFKKKMYI